MADPLSIIGAAGAVGGVINLLTKTIRSLSDLRAQWKIVDTVVATFELQLTALNTALVQIKKWADANSDDPHYQLAIDLDRCLSHCELLVNIISAEIDTLKGAEGDQSLASRISLLFRTQGMAEIQKMVDQVTNALGLLLTACSSATLLEQCSLIQRPLVRQSITKIEKDTRSLLVHRDADSLQSIFASTISSSKRSLVFEFDKELLPSRIYRIVLQGSVRLALRRQQGDSSLLDKREGPKSPDPITPRYDSKRLHAMCQMPKPGAGTDKEARALREVRGLIQTGANTNAVDAVGRAPLSHAAGQGFDKMARLLIDGGADVNAKDANGRTALSHAARWGQETVVRLLLDHGANANVSDRRGLAPLSYAVGRASARSLSIAKLLLDAGADINAKDERSNTALSHAITYSTPADDFSVVELLLKHGVEVEDKISPFGVAMTPLLWAASKGHVEFVELLLDGGAYIEAVQRRMLGGRTPLLCAAKVGNPLVVEKLLNHGANIEARDTGFGLTALSIAASNGHVEVTRLLLERGADVKASDNAGRSPIFWANESGKEELVNLLAEYGTQWL
ncbi:ankyrin repeat-containing domain protein [Cercophora newfieldiana]|uniref:Ankyrin repeat-containing domain protein n=1 Tax=Cercophora newfieldiana TaxID=92897 RepID=A0AA39YAF2_9PEZI|nr:ankyrin repeat-containing domain protein [Cercophora newfieldiana]